MLTFCCSYTTICKVEQTARANGEKAGKRLFNRIAVLRAERDLSRQDLAGAVGVNYQTIGYLERGEYNPSLDLALRISAYFKLPIEAIFCGTRSSRLAVNSTRKRIENRCNAKEVN